MFKQVALSAVLAVAAVSASAATATIDGDGFTITYDTALTGLFGTPTLVGNVLSWFPSGSPGFTAQSSSGFAVTNSTFSLMVTADAGYTLNGFSLVEGGDYFYFGDTGATAGVDVSGQLRVTSLPGSTSATSIVETTTYSANSFLNFDTNNWAASAATTPLTGVTQANVSVQNILAAYVLGGAGYSFIEKKEAFLTLSVSPVPEPETYALFLAGIAAVGFVVARRRNAS